MNLLLPPAQHLVQRAPRVLVARTGADVVDDLLAGDLDTAEDRVLLGREVAKEAPLGQPSRLAISSTVVWSTPRSANSRSATSASSPGAAVLDGAQPDHGQLVAGLGRTASVACRWTLPAAFAPSRCLTSPTRPSQPTATRRSV
ncbi:hypothetical protein ABIH81_19735 [Micromonospora sp. HUAS YX12]|uniref:Uncharacterized protein n=1 Tax=Micromonospora sp. HUAS YX12 TaxID=3156396 RepID=A0AAU7QUI1_9ACTN